MKNHFSKSKYCRLWQCPKMLWMDKYKPEEKAEDATDDSRMEAGTEVGKLARELFGKPVDVTETVNGQLNLPAMTDRTQVEIEHETSVICEASFSYQGCYCAVDILKRENDGWAIYEVKSSTVNEKNMKAVYVADVAYQKYVLEHCGVRITGTYIVSINNDYVYDGKLDLERLFQITDVSEFVRNEIGEVEKNLLQEDTLLESENEPKRELGLYCKDPYGCPYWEYCAKELPTPSVFDLYRMPLKKKLEYYREGNSDYRQLKDCGKIKNEKQLRQIEFALEDKGTYVNIDGIREFLSTLSYPLYFLDFETMQPVIPLFPGTKPYQQIPFQYSLHYIESAGAPLLHKEFLAESGENPLRAIAEALCRDIPMNVCVTAYNKSFECSRIKELAGMFPDLAEHLLNIRDNIKDLLDPFQAGNYYNRAMGGSFSIKSVLPAIFPNDPELNYHNLEGVHNGSEAMTIFPRIKDMAFKYLYCCKHDSAMEERFKACHMPLDSFSLEWFKRKFKEKNFSNLDSYSENNKELPENLFTKKGEKKLKAESIGSWSSMQTWEEDCKKQEYPYEFYAHVIKQYCKENSITPLQLDFIVWSKMQKIMAAESFIKTFKDDDEENKEVINSEELEPYDILNLKTTLENRLSEIRPLICK